MATELKPCPFCGGTNTHMKANGRVWLGMKYSEPASVSVVHWCEPMPGQPSRQLERVGRDEASAAAAWNMRADGVSVVDQQTFSQQTPMDSGKAEKQSE